MSLETQSSMQTYHLLVKELLKSNPEEKKVKDLMEDLGLTYTTEHIERLTRVLAFNPINKKDFI
jgi:hypothetical protein